MMNVRVIWREGTYAIHPDDLRAAVEACMEQRAEAVAIELGTQLNRALAALRQIQSICEEIPLGASRQNSASDG
jgi:hypothetical protein